MKYIEHRILKQKKLDLSCWGEWFDREYVERHFYQEKEHQEHLEICDAAILKSFDKQSGTPRWNLLKVWLADEKEVNDGEADKIGEVMSASGFIICFCPICGENLS